MESLMCTCSHHLTRHDENVERCAVPRCNCTTFTPVPVVPVGEQIELVQLGGVLACEVSKLNVGLNQRPLDARGVTDAVRAAEALSEVSTVLATALKQLNDRLRK